VEPILIKRQIHCLGKMWMKHKNMSLHQHFLNQMQTLHQAIILIYMRCQQSYPLLFQNPLIHQSNQQAFLIIHIQKSKTFLSLINLTKARQRPQFHNNLIHFHYHIRYCLAQKFNLLLKIYFYYNVYSCNQSRVHQNQYQI